MYDALASSFCTQRVWSRADNRVLGHRGYAPGGSDSVRFQNTQPDGIRRRTLSLPCALTHEDRFADLTEATVTTVTRYDGSFTKGIFAKLPIFRRHRRVHSGEAHHPARVLRKYGEARVQPLYCRTLIPLPGLPRLQMAGKILPRTVLQTTKGTLG